MNGTDSTELSWIDTWCFTPSQPPGVISGRNQIPTTGKHSDSLPHTHFAVEDLRTLGGNEVE